MLVDELVDRCKRRRWRQLSFSLQELDELPDGLPPGTGFARVGALPLLDTFSVRT
jgi:hypothetical protein